MPQPLLSICIPTFNRAETLRMTLVSTLAQIAQFGDEVELIISDNCSPDHTQEVIAEASACEQVRAHRNDFNTGIDNFFILTNKLARGKYCWLIGDDDIIINGQLGEIISLLKKYPQYDYFFANNTTKSINTIREIVLENNSCHQPRPEDWRLSDFSLKFFDRWEDLLTVPNDLVITLGTTIVNHILRRELWQEYSAKITPPTIDLRYTLNGIFPHLKTVIGAMAGRPVVYIGQPCTIAGVGDNLTDWGQYVDIFFTFPLVELMDYYIELGIDRNLINIYQESLLDYCGMTIPNLFLKIKNEGVAGNEFLAQKLDEFIKRFPVKNMYWSKENDRAMKMEFRADTGF